MTDAVLTDELTTEELTEELGAWEILGKYLRRPGFLLSLLGLGTLVLYSGALFFDFVWDDWPQIVNSPILRSWHNLPRAFSSDLWYHVARHQVYYRPLFVTWSMLNYSLFELRPWGWHLAAILVHVAATACVFWLARKLGLEYWTAALAALIYALHPIHIEPVVWISAASDTMVTMFVALAFVAFLNGRNPSQSKRALWWVASLLLLILALLSKEMAVSFSGLVALYAWLHPKEGKSSFGSKTLFAAVEAAPYAILTAAYILLRKHALLTPTGPFDPSHGLIDVFRTLPLVVSIYIKKLFVPVGLTGLYYTPYVTNHVITQIVVPVFALVSLATVLWYWNRREGNSLVAFAAFWLAIGLAPALLLRNFGNGDFVRDRYICLGSVGFAILLAMALRRLPSISGWSASTVQACAVAVLCFCYVGASLAQQVYWASDLLVLMRGQSLYPGNPYTMVGLALEYSKRGAHPQAIQLAEEAVRIHPEYGYSRLSLAEVYIRAGKFDAGRVWLEEAMRINPDYAVSESGMAGLAGLYGRMGDYKKSLAYCDQILARDPNLYSALFNCGNVRLMAGQYAEARSLLLRAIAAAPEQAAPKHYLGRAFIQDGKNDDAKPYLEAAVAMDPKVWDYHYWLGVSFEESGDLPAARAQYQQALQLNPDGQEPKLRLKALEGK